MYTCFSFFFLFYSSMLPAQPPEKEQEQPTTSTPVDTFPSGFSYLEKKNIKDNEYQYNATLAVVHAKLGKDWALVVDWHSFEKLVGNASDRKSLGTFVYSRYLNPIGAEVAKWTDLAEAANDKIKGKKIVISARRHMGNRTCYTLTSSKDAIELALNPETVSNWYPVKDSSFTQLLEKSL